MASHDRRLHSRFRGALLGCAVGDALGFPYKDHSRSFVRSLGGHLTAAFERHRSSFYPVGQYSEDAQAVLAVADALIEAGAVDGQSVADHLVPLWRDLLVVDGSRACAEAIEPLLRGEASWDGCGLPVGRVESCAVARSIPLGLWDHLHLDALPPDVEAVSAITHRDYRVAASSAAIAAAVAHGIISDDLVLGDFLDAVAAAAGRFSGDLAEVVLDFPRILSQTEAKAAEIIAGFAARSLGRDPPPLDQGVGDNSLHASLAALYVFLKSPFDLERALEGAIRWGGDVSTLGALVGAVGGSLVGEEAIPGALAASVLDGPAIVERADRLLARWQERRPAR